MTNNQFHFTIAGSYSMSPWTLVLRTYFPTLRKNLAANNCTVHENCLVSHTAAPLLMVLHKMLSYSLVYGPNGNPPNDLDLLLLYPKHHLLIWPHFSANTGPKHLYFSMTLIKHFDTRKAYFVLPVDCVLKRNTVDSRFPEFQGTLWNISKYPYLDISGLRKWGKQ